MKTKTLIVGDSLSLPRAAVRYEETWPVLLSNVRTDHRIIVLSRRGMTSRSLIADGTDGPGYPPGSDFLEFYHPDNVVLQLGIVDCFPRHFRESGIIRMGLALLPAGPRNAYLKFVKKYQGAKARFAFVSANDFQKNLDTYLQRAAECHVGSVLLISIGPISDGKSEGAIEARSQIALYNEILRKVANNHPIARICEPFEDSVPDPACFLEDGYHLSALGHEKLAEKISKAL